MIKREVGKFYRLTNRNDVFIEVIAEVKSCLFGNGLLEAQVMKGMADPYSLQIRDYNWYCPGSLVEISREEYFAVVKKVNEKMEHYFDDKE
jgi:hypothetical protein